MVGRRPLVAIHGEPSSRLGLAPPNSRHAAHSLCSRPYAGDGFGGKAIVHEGGSGSRPLAGPAAREALGEMARSELVGEHREGLDQRWPT